MVNQGTTETPQALDEDGKPVVVPKYKRRCLYSIAIPEPGTVLVYYTREVTQHEFERNMAK